MGNPGNSFNGVSPPVTITTQQGNSTVAPFAQASEVTRDRTIIRRMFPTNSVNGTPVFSKTWALSPFRVTMNAGDLTVRRNDKDGASGNQHYVYDASDYTRFKGLNEKQKLYNDYTFGGANNGAYRAIMRMHRR